MATGRVYGRIDSKDLAMIFARAARLAGDTPGEERTRELGKRLLEEVLDQARSRRPEGSSDTYEALPAAAPAGSVAPRRLDLQGLRGKIDQLITQARDAKSKSSDGGAPAPARADETEPATEPATTETPSGKFRRPGGRLGTETLDGMFLKGSQVKFDGYMEDVESLLVDLYDTFMAASSEGVDVFEMLDAGTLLGESVDGLESRRAGRRARKLSGSNAFPGLGQARELHAGQPPAGRAPSGGYPRPGSSHGAVHPPRPTSGRQPRPASARQPRSGSERLPAPGPGAGRQPPAAQQPRPASERLQPPAAQQPRPGSERLPPPASGRFPTHAPASRPQPAPDPPSGRHPRQEPGWGWDKPASTAPASIQFINPGLLSVRCACNVERQIDTSVLRPWRVRCKRCKQVLFDPSSTMVVGDARVSAEDTQELDRWMAGSHEHLRRLNPNETTEAMRCPTHPLQFVIAACKKCNRLLCRACVDQVGDALVCSDCSGGGAHDSATFAEPAQARMSAQEVRHAFERQLLLAGMEAWLERGPRGGARMIQVVYDAQRRVFKAPLDPPMQVGHQIRFPDGRLFDVRIVRRFEADGTPCYQEVEAHQVG